MLRHVVGSSDEVSRGRRRGTSSRADRSARGVRRPAGQEHVRRPRRRHPPHRRRAPRGRRAARHAGRAARPMRRRRPRRPARRSASACAPATDAAIMLALCHMLVAEGLHDRAFLERYCSGADAFLATLGDARGTPEWAEGISGVPASTVRDLARRMAAGRTMVTTTWSLQRAEYGEQPVWAAIALAALLGQIGLPGGGFGNGYGSMADVGADMPRGGRAGAAGRDRRDRDRSSRSRGSPTCCCSPASPSSSTASGTRTRHARIVYWAGGNPFHHHQDLNRLRRALGAAGHDARAGAVLDRDGAPRRHRAPGDDDARAQRHRRRPQRRVR